MTVKVLYFARLREELGRDGEQAELPAEGCTVAGLWENLHGEPPPQRLMTAVNQSQAGPDTPVRDGDEVAFFPPVTGG
ncbi:MULTISPECIES: molybdopterin converting factor subunit 1 [Thioalkalivibrio]|uniref:Molybdopterin synthase sulfur carrier subunit n=1 Tax=Thioalkalivibrio halophilus TaxID=252474 RepID=A0A1V2ZXI9_9GAMM|nr:MULTISPECIES: molybdopterin converting factor subunit 1 [Thioalkalivibrio]OOC09731.1 molybdopterin converting factor subunit 1 [Thioalkalivibrio halophilus]PYG03678.1 molybdopterin synthase subunit MoaD [Thioalkalivibrio sp. ALE21]